MNISKTTIITISIVAIIFVSLLIFERKQSTPTTSAPTLTIGILQTASHPALDAAREGFMEALHKELPDVTFIIHNAQGAIASAHTIAQSFHTNQSINGIFAIATLAARSAAVVEKQKPIFIAAVTDPQAAGLMGTDSNVCGSSDAISSDTIIDLVQQLVPTARTVALLFNTSEMNSQIQVERLVATMRQRNLEPIKVGVTTEADVAPAVTSACAKADVLVLPNDNIMSSSIQLIASLALKHKKPLIASDNLLVTRGALAARGVDYKASGAQAAQCAVAVLRDGKQPSELPIAQPVMGPIMVNKKTAAALGIVIPATLHDHVNFIN